MKIICVGRNYAAHAKELNNAVEEEPVIFMKPETALIPAKFPFFYPEFSTDIHYETELVIKINRIGKNISEKFAHRYYDEVSLGIDFTARDLQSKLKAKGLPWERAKAFDGSAPVGDFIPLKDAGNIDDLHFTLLVNDEVRQSGHSANMIFTVDKIIAFVSTFVTLKKGDLIFTGTPEGVGPVKPGDKLTALLGDKQLLSFDIK
ncbi:MAG TPA: fumarylacetoacetate hydrolase family protein [Bacteroidia bacterium]|jgi:2-keto-4-pentenoate hydratase/2-oxohepta-3-ene-1,7-dioic acid hydratase in catechol pathway|nr:fumarylacetoacetate hydrolase family protein [Bacteroidia bacterium]